MKIYDCFLERRLNQMVPLSESIAVRISGICYSITQVRMLQQIMTRVSRGSEIVVHFPVEDMNIYDAAYTAHQKLIESELAK